MLTVICNDIAMTRGDTVRLRLEVTDSAGAEYAPGAGDRLRFTVKREMSDAQPAIAKILTGAERVVTLLPEDTAGLEFGRYYYDVELTLAGGAVHTVIPPHLFDLLGEVSA